MPKALLHRDIRGQLVFMGTGTSHGVPVIGCGCATCTSTDRRNNRTRCSVAIGLPEGNAIIDTPPELRVQLLREEIGLVHAVLFTHAHADHLFGLDDVRIFPRHLGHPLPIYCEDTVEAAIRRAFAYAFDPAVQKNPAGGLPQVAIQRIGLEPFSLLGTKITPLRLLHGRQPILGYRVGDVAYCTDVKTIPAETLARLEGLDVLVLDCLRYESHPTHLSVEEALGFVERLRPRRTLFTHLNHHLEHVAISSRLPAGVELAFDGLRIPLPLERP